MKQIIFLLSSVFWLGAASATESPNAQVLLMGTFHFANPGLDAVKTETVDVMTAANQNYLIALAERIAATKPTKVLLEYDPKEEDKINKQYRDYITDNFELPVNEIYQLGFRVARMAGLNSVHSFDERSVNWQAEKLFTYMGEQAPEEKQKFEARIAEITEKLNHVHATLSLQQQLRYFNGPELDKANMAMYLATNHIDAGSSFVGADASASWWHRNFRMYAMIQHHAAPGERVFVLGGQGHTAILKQLLELDPNRDSLDINTLL
jgi:hypothetical protein